MRQASLSHFLLGQISLGVYRENNMFNETISPDISRNWSMGKYIEQIKSRINALNNQ